MSLFGANKPAFGSTTGTSSFTFPAATNSSSAAPLFGSTTTTTTAKPLFGSTTQAASTPSLFGGTSTTTTAAGTSLFGAAPTTTTASAGGFFSQAPSGSLFNKRAATTATPSLFGGAPATTTATGTGLFGGSMRLRGRLMDATNEGLTNFGFGTSPQRFLRRRAAVSNLVLHENQSSSASSPGADVAAESAMHRSNNNDNNNGKRSSHSASEATPLTSMSSPVVTIGDIKRGVTLRPPTTTSSATAAETTAAALVESFFRPPPTPHPCNLPSKASAPRAFFPATSTPATPSLAAFGSNTAGSSFFGSKPAGTGLFGSTMTQQQQQAQQQQQTTAQQQVLLNYHPFVRAVGNPQVMGNEKDQTIAYINQIAAAVGVGKGVYRDGNQIATVSMENNCFNRFVGIGYNRASTRKDEDGVVSLIIRCEPAELESEERRHKMLEILNAILGDNPSVRADLARENAIRKIAEGQTEVLITVREGGFTVPAMKLAQFLNEPSRQTQLETQLRVDKTKTSPKIGMNTAQREKYLETVPDGVDEKVWHMAIHENPDPSKLLPYPVRGWQELRERQKAQISEANLQKNALMNLGGQIEKLENEHAGVSVELNNIVYRHKQLSYRLIRIVLGQWINKRFSRQIDVDEDRIEAQLDTLLAKLNRKDQIQPWISYFQEVLVKNGDRLKKNAETFYDMSEEDQVYAQQVLTELTYIFEKILGLTQQQYVDLELVRKTLEGE